ncbi:MAG: hypothetical protein R3313_00840 [Candidatus Saccharimonadales bacterium]|nr:hypothetical protein [Candidatus Saccharimonadales bacterium]
MHNQHGLLRGWLIFLIIFFGLATAFLIWYFVIREESVPQDVTTVTVEYEEDEDDAPQGLNWYHNDEKNLHFLYPEGWNLNKREFGNAPKIDKADVSLTASDFDISYFAERDARIILDLPEELFCQENKNIKVWSAYVDGDQPQSTTDKRCAKPELLVINNYLSPAFENDAKSIYSYTIFAPFAGGGGMAFIDSVPIPDNASITSKGTIIDDMKSKLRDKVSAFTANNQPLLADPQPAE